MADNCTNYGNYYELLRLYVESKDLRPNIAKDTTLLDAFMENMKERERLMTLWAASDVSTMVVN